MKVHEPALAWRGTLTPRSTTTAVVLHHAEASRASVEEIHRWHLGRGWAGIGYHYYIRKSGDIYRGRPEWALGAHAVGANDYTLGICCEGSYMTEAMPAAQLDSLHALLRDIMSRYGALRVLRHKDVGSTDCPGDNFPWQAALAFHEEEDDMTNEQVQKIVQQELARLLPRAAAVSELDAALQGEIQALIDAGALRGEGGSEAAKGLDLTADMARTLIISKRYTDSKKPD